MLSPQSFTIHTQTQDETMETGYRIQWVSLKLIETKKLWKLITSQQIEEILQ